MVTIQKIGPEEVAMLLQLEEDHFQELKSKDIKPAKLTKAISAFANAEGGELFVGISEGDPASGTPHLWRGFANQEEANGHIQAFDETFGFAGEYRLTFLEADGQDGLVLKATVQKSKQVCFASDHHAYLRRGPRNAPVTGAEEIRRLELNKGVTSYENQTVPVELEVITQSEVLRKFMRTVVPHQTPEQWVKKEYLVDDGKPTVAGLVLFADIPQAALPKHCGIKLYRYKTTAAEGTRDTLAFDPITIEGCAYDQIHEAVIRTVSEVQGIQIVGPKGLESVQYPDEALHEVVTNAVIHRDYSLADDVHIRIFDNRIEVESPGTLPGHITPENIRTERLARNGRIVRLLNKFPDAPNKDVGEGLNTAFESMQKLGLKPPRIEPRQHSVRVVIPHDKLASPEQQIVEYLQTQPEINRSTAQQLTAIESESKIQKVLKALVDGGEIEPTGKRGRAASYRLSEAAADDRREDRNPEGEGDSPASSPVPAKPTAGAATPDTPTDPDDMPTPTDAPSDRREDRTIEQEMRQSFLDYAMSVIVSRALPDARDGLKPVHRRILYAMSELGMGHTQGYKKSATAVGEVLGKYHPHGDSAIYDAMVRMAQPWSLRYPLVDGQGNFGSVDGDGAAAMRYTEARLARVAAPMLSDIDKDTVDWQPNYDGRLKEPLALPAAVPNLLVNGSDGIAVGMATKIAPHNLGEVIDATVRLIDEPEVDVMGLMEHVHGPDFPTGGIIYGRSGILHALGTGRGRIIVRGKHSIESLGADRERIVFTEIPYQVNKATLLMTIADLAKDKVIEGISDLRDESDRRGMRMVIELRKDAITDVVLNQLWKHTPLQSSYSINNLALVDGRPRTLDLKTMLQVFLDHRFEVVTRRTRFELDKAEKRAHIVEGLLTALDNIDDVVHLIRASQDADTARNGLMERFGLSEAQSKAILEMRLQKLTGLESDALRAEFEELRQMIEYYRSVLADPAKVFGIIKDELQKIRDDFADERRTAIEDGEIDIEDEDLIPEEMSVYTFTREGYLKRQPIATYREQNRGGKGLKGMKAKEDDHILGTSVGSTHDWLCFFTNTGRVHWLKGYRVPLGSRQGRGKPVQNLIQLDAHERVENIIPVRDFEAEGEFLFFATKQGIVKKTPLSAYKNIRQVGIKAIELREGDELLGVRKTDGHRDIILATRYGQACRFDESEVRSMGRVASGVRGINLAEGDEAVALAVAEEGCDLLTVTKNGFGKRTPLEDYRKTHRGSKGVRTIVVNERNGGVRALRTVTGEESILIITREGMVVRTPVDQISTLGRSTQGVRIVRLNDSDEVTQVAVLQPEEDEEAAQDGVASVAPAEEE